MRHESILIAAAHDKMVLQSKNGTEAKPKTKTVHFFLLKNFQRNFTGANTGCEFFREVF